jgi:O-antigen ligase
LFSSSENNLFQLSRLGNVPAILIGLLFLVLPLVYWPNFIEAASLPRYFLIGIVTTSALLVWLVSLSYQTQALVWQPAFWLVIAFFGWAAISTAWSPDAGTSLIEISQLASMTILSFLGLTLSRHPRFTSFILPAILTGGFIAAMLGVGQHYGFNPFEFRLNEKNIASTFINRNHAAVYFDLIIPIAVIGIIYFRTSSYSLLSSSTAGFGIAFLLVNKNRGSLLSFVVILCVFFIILLANKPFRRLILERLSAKRYYLIIAIAIPLLVSILPSRTAEELEWNTKLLELKVDSSTEIRFNAYINSLQPIQQHPLIGSGYGGFRKSFRPYATTIRPRTSLKEENVMGALHNDPLQYFVELGLPGFTLALLIYYTILRRGWPIRDSEIYPDKSILKLGLFLAIMAGGIHSLVDFPLRLPTSAAVFWFYLGSLLGLSATNTRTLSISPLLRKVLFGTGLIYLLFTLGFYFQYFKGSHYLYNATVNIHKNDCQNAAVAIENSMTQFDLNYVTQNRYAQIYTYCDFPVTTKLTAMDRILAYDETNTRARLTRGILNLQLHKTAEATQDLLYVVKVLPHRPLAYIGLGDIAVLEGRYQKAEHLYLAGLKRDPANSHARDMLNRISTLPKADNPKYQ